MLITILFSKTRHLITYNIYLTVCLLQTGIGISEEDQEKLWIPFALIRPGDAQEGRGSGLALPLAKEILTLHGGSVSLSSEVGQGSTFGFTVPLKVLGPEERARVMLLLPRASANASNASVAGLGLGGGSPRPGGIRSPQQGSKRGPGQQEGFGQQQQREKGSGRKTGLEQRSSQRHLGFPLSKQGSSLGSERLGIVQSPRLATATATAAGPTAAGPTRLSLKAKRSKNTILRRALSSKDQLQPVPAYRLD